MNAIYDEFWAIEDANSAKEKLSASALMDSIHADCHRLFHDLEKDHNSCGYCQLKLQKGGKVISFAIPL